MFVSLNQHLPGPSNDVWTLGITASCSNSFIGTQQMLMHEKNKCGPYIVWSFSSYIIALFNETDCEIADSVTNIRFFVFWFHLSHLLSVCKIRTSLNDFCEQRFATKSPKTIVYAAMLSRKRQTSVLRICRGQKPIIICLKNVMHH